MTSTYVRCAVLAAVAFATLWAPLRLRRPSAPDSRPNLARPAQGQAAAASLLFGAPLDLNTATEDDLRALPGIGKERAHRIVALRDARGGRFLSVMELADVPGVGRTTLRWILPKVTVATGGVTRR
jgi:competence ComEA-like helix-hairpin-helix protein